MIAQTAGPSPSGALSGRFRLKVLLPPLLLLGSFVGGLATVGSAWVRDLTVAAAHATALTAAQDLWQSPEFSQGVQRGDHEKVHQAFLRTLDGEPALAYLALRQGTNEELVVRAGNPDGLLGARATLRQIHEAVHGSAQRSPAGAELSITRQVVPPALTAPAPPLSDAGPAEVFVGVSLSRQGAEYRAGLYTLELLSAIGALTYLLISLFLFGGFSRRLEQLAQGVRRLQEGDFQVRVGAVAPPELADLGRAVDEAAGRIGRVVQRTRLLLALLERTARDVGEATAGLRHGAAAQSGDTEDAAGTAQDLTHAFAGLVRQVEAVREDTRLSATIAQRLATMGQEAAISAEEAERLSGGVVEGLEQGAAFVVDVARQAAVISESAVAASGGLGEVKLANHRLHESASGAATLAEHASGDAERGAAAVAESVSGIEQVQAAARTIATVTGSLQRRVGEIGDILHLITELAQRTNLLALNASIIAAQAGAEGRGFAVVADEIKDLARRTASSAGSIDTLIQGLGEGAEAARRAAVAGGEAADAGLSRAREAGRTLGLAVSRLRSWSQLGRALAGLTDEQARVTLHVVRAVQEVQAQVVELHTRAGEQARRGDLVLRQGLRLREVVGLLAGAADEGREGTAQVADTLQRLAQGVEEMSSAERGRMAEAERLRGLLALLRRAGAGQREALAALDRAAADLRAEAAALSEELTALRA